MFMINGKSVNVELPPSKTSRTPFARHGQPLEADCSALKPKAQWGRSVCHVGREVYDQWVPWRNYFAGPEPEVLVPEPSAALRRKSNEARFRLRRKKRMAAGDTRSKNASVQCQMKTMPTAEESVTMVRHKAVQANLTPGYLWKHIAPVVHRKWGVDACTQVTYDQLTDFDTKAYRLTEFLTVTLLTEAAKRVLYEDDAAALRREQAAVRRRRLTERTEIMRLKHKEARRRRKALRALAAEERETPESTYRAVHSRAMAEYYTRGMAADVVEELVSTGSLVDDNRIDPAQFLAGSGSDRFRCRERIGVPMDALIGDMVANRARLHRDVVGSRNDAAEREDAVIVVNTFLQDGETDEIRSFPSTDSFQNGSMYRMEGSPSSVLPEFNYEYEHEIEEGM